MTQITKHGIILEKTDNHFENFGVLNPAIYQEDKTVHMFYRAIRDDYFSSIGHCVLDGPLKVIKRGEEPVFFPKESYEFKGVEDPRITKIEDTFYLSYAACDGINVFGALATSKDLFHWERKGIITPKLTFEEFAKLILPICRKISPDHRIFYMNFLRYRLKNLLKGKVYVWDKNVVFFPRKINGKYYFLHRLFPSIQIVHFNDFSELTKEFWKDYVSKLHKHIVMAPHYQHEDNRIGAGCPPIETEHGWLLIYYSAQNTPRGLVYHVCAALFDLEDPSKLIARLKKPLFSPTEPYELEGHFSNMIYPTGAAIFDGELYVYYGTANNSIAAASINLKDLLDKLLHIKTEMAAVTEINIKV
ncbi:MAG: pesticidal protein Cry7Aa [Lutibacter sp.]